MAADRAVAHLARAAGLDETHDMVGGNAGGEDAGAKALADRIGSRDGKRADLSEIVHHGAARGRDVGAQRVDIRLGFGDDEESSFLRSLTTGLRRPGKM